MNSDHRAPNRLPVTPEQRRSFKWLASDEEQNLRWPWWRWFWINSFTNAKSVVWGIAHLPRTVHWKNSPWTFAPKGLNYGYSIPDGSTRRYPFVSYRGFLWLEFKIGWETNGALTLGSCRIENAKNTAEHP